MAGWIDVLLSYDFQILHRPGVLNIVPDRLSRIYAQLPTAHWASMRFRRECYQPECNVQADTQAELSNIATRSILPPEARAEALEESHLMGHFGVLAVVRNLLHRGRYWPGMRKDVEEFVKSCAACQRFTITQRGYHPLKPILASAPFDSIGIDLSLAFKTSRRGNNILLIVVCHFTRFLLLRALPDKAAASVAVALFEIFCDFGFPRVIISDNGTEFVNQLIEKMVSLCGIDHRLSTKYHPRGNGLSERFVGIATRAIKKLLDGEDELWDYHHRAVQLYINAKIADFHQSAPFSAMFARRINEFADFSHDQSAPPYQYEQIKAHLAFASDILYPALRDRALGHASRAIRRFAKHKRILTEPFPNGSYVMLIDPRRSQKTEPVYIGPFKVLRKNRGGAYLLLDSDGTLFQRNVAPSQLKLISKDPKHDALSLVVDRILAHRGPPSRREYLVRWKSLPKSEDSWEPASNFDDLQCIRFYWQAHSSNRVSTLGGGNVVPNSPSTAASSAGVAPPVASRSADLPLPHDYPTTPVLQPLRRSQRTNRLDTPR